MDQNEEALKEITKEGNYALIAIVAPAKHVFGKSLKEIFEGDEIYKKESNTHELVQVFSKKEHLEPLCKNIQSAMSYSLKEVLK